ncbi:hypothetical protein HYR54_00535 [Candidatus Acetothermia bacterium]|nr:hypothetical protein [Candidatus Acetothermia bacterium]
MARNRKRNGKKNGNGNALAVLEGASPIEKVASQMSEVDKALLGELVADRKAILKIGGLVLDHERRIQGLEDALGELAGEPTKDAIDISKE